MDLNTEELLKLERFKTANLSKKLAEARNTIDEYEAKMFYYESKLLSLRNVFICYEKILWTITYGDLLILFWYLLKTKS